MAQHDSADATTIAAKGSRTKTLRERPQERPSVFQLKATPISCQIMNGG
jgi:hypothetical protein